MHYFLPIILFVLAPVPHAQASVVSTTTIVEIIDQVAERYDLNKEHFKKTLECESAGFTNTQSQISNPKGPNGFEDSWGVVQIYLPAHPEISREQALNPYWAIDWAGQMFADGHASLWTCWREMYGSPS